MVTPDALSVFPFEVISSENRRVKGIFDKEFFIDCLKCAAFIAFLALMSNPNIIYNFLKGVSGW